MGWLTDALRWLADPAHWQGPDGVPHRLLEHVGLSAAAVGIGCLLALPLGVWLGHVRRGGTVAVAGGNLARAVPTFAVLVLLALAPSPFGLGTVSTLTALVLFAVPPLLTNAYVGVTEVDPAVVDAARGTGLTDGQVLRRVELPLAVPLLMNGVRLAAVQVVATATIAALVAGGGLGRIIVEGFGRQDQPQLVAGALLVLVLALTVEGVLEVVQRRADPLRGARRGRRPAPTRGAGPAGSQVDVQPGSS